MLDLPERQAKDEDETGAAVRKWLKGNPGWLLILDNVDTEEAKQAVVRLLPALAGGHVLITSRRRSWPHEVHKQSLDKISQEEARDFLLKRTVERRPATDDPSQAERLAERLDGLPLALEQAAAYINRTRLSFSDYLEAWEHDRKGVMVWYDEAVMRYPFSVAMTWQKSFDQMKPISAALLRLTSFLAPEPIQEEMFKQEKGTVEQAAELLCTETSQEPGESSIDEALADLEGYSLISRQGDTFTVHRVVQEVVQCRIPTERRRDWIATSLQVVNDYSPFDSDDVRTWAVWDILRPHAKLVAALADEAGIINPTTWLLGRLATLLWRKGLYSEAEPLIRRALAIDEAFYGSEHPRVAEDISNLALLLRTTNRLSEAETLMRRALAIDEAFYGNEHPTAAYLNNLAQLLQDTNRFSEAEPLMRRSLAIDEASYGNEHPTVAIDLNNLAQLLQDTNRLPEAEPLMRRALAIDEASYGNEHPTVARDLNNLAQLLQVTNRLSEAEVLMRRALAIDEAAYGNDHSEVAIVLNNLSILLSVTNRLSEAEPLMRRAMEIWERSLGPDHPSTKTVQKNLSFFLKKIAGQNSPSA